MTGRIFSVERREIPRDGKPALVREVVIHPGAVTVLPILENGSIVMIHNFRHAVERELLELPAGTLEVGENPAACAVRELEEETGYVAKEVQPFCEFFTTPGIANERMQVFWATGLTPHEQRLDEGEQIRVEVLPAEQVRQMVTDGRIQDGKTLAILGQYFLRNQG